MLFLGTTQGLGSQPKKEYSQKWQITQSGTGNTILHVIANASGIVTFAAYITFSIQFLSVATWETAAGIR